MLLRCRRSATIVRAPAAMSCSPSRAPAWLAPTNPIAAIPAVVAAVTPAGESSTTMQSQARTAHVRGGMQEQVGCWLALWDVAGGKEIIEEPRKTGSLQAGTDTVAGRRRCHAFRPAQPGQCIGCVRHGTQFRAQPLDRGGGDRGSQMRRQLALGRCLDHREHIGRSATDEVTGHELWRDRHAGAREFLRSNRCRNLLAVDQHPVAIEDDHASPTQHPAGLRRILIPTNHCMT